MTDLIQAALSLQSGLDRLGLPNCLIGGLALQAWGQTRFTKDMDFTVLTNFEDEPAKVEAILGLLSPRNVDPQAFARIYRVVLGTYEGVPVDIGLGGFEYERQVVDRAVMVVYGPDVRLRVCSAEDLVIMKVFAGRGQDWPDVEGVLVRQGARFNWSLIETELPPLLELVEDPARMPRLIELHQAANRD